MKKLYTLLSQTPNAKKAFTFSEILIVLLIIGIISAIVVPSYGKQQLQLRFNQSLIDSIGIIKTARNYAVTSRATKEGVIPPEGYGVYINKAEKRFVLFANTDIAGNNINQYDTGDTFEKEYIFPDAADFDALLRNGKIDDIGDRAVIIFRPPIAEVTIGLNGAPAAVMPPITEFDTLYIQLSKSDGNGDDKFITINRISGFPEIEL